MNRIQILILACAMLCLANLNGFAQTLVDSSFKSGDFPLVQNKTAATILVDAAEPTVVRMAADNLAADIERVTSVKPAVKNGLAGAGRDVVIIGTVGGSPLLDKIAGAGKLNLGKIKGKWETFLIATVADPLPGVKSALVIAGSDRRGAAYGVYELSEQIGVSPWYWWADVTPQHRDALAVRASISTQGPPSVKYRGIFINDEDWGMQPWAAKTLEPETGDIGPKTYARIFELLLRLKANLCWPAMHPCTKAFNLNPKNKQVADDYAIVMGSSHCEPLLRCNVTEWDVAQRGPWDYDLNRAGLLKYWEERLKENGKFDNIYTIGMRGIHDGPMPGNGTTAEKVKRLQSVITDERDLISRLVNPDPAKVPQIFCPYKEVLTLYQNGLKVPDDVTLVWSDDNHGYIRQLPTPEEQKRSGGSGVYYHLSYWGAPQDYLWLCSTPPALIWEELTKAYAYGARTLWVVNVGDLKPAEIGIDFSMKLAWNVERWKGRGVSDTFFNQWTGSNFGAEWDNLVVKLLRDEYLINFQRKPEHMVAGLFSMVNYGDETEGRLMEYDELVKWVDDCGNQTPENLRDAYYELVQYPARCSRLMNRKVLLAEKSLFYAKQGRASAVDYARQAREAYDQIQKETEYYNTKLAGGKWNGIMSAAPRKQKVFEMPPVAQVKVPEVGHLGVVLEGSETPLTTSTQADDSILNFDGFIGKHRFIDIFNTGTKPIQWTAKPSEPWIFVPGYENSSDYFVAKDNRLRVSIDWDKAPLGDDVKGSITIEGGGRKYIVNVSVFNPVSPRPQEVNGYVESGGCVAMEAEHFTRNVDRNGAGWRRIPDLGRTGVGSVTVLPPAIPSVENPADFATKSPALEYDMTLFHGGAARVLVTCLPTHRPYPGRGVRYAVALDDEAPQIVNVDNDGNRAWNVNVLQAAAVGTSQHQVKAPGKHTLKIWMVDPGVVLDKIVVDLGGVKPSYLGPPETYGGLNY